MSVGSASKISIILSLLPSPSYRTFFVTSSRVVIIPLSLVQTFPCSRLISSISYRPRLSWLYIPFVAENLPLSLFSRKGLLNLCSRQFGSSSFVQGRAGVASSLSHSLIANRLFCRRRISVIGDISALCFCTRAEYIRKMAPPETILLERGEKIAHETNEEDAKLSASERRRLRRAEHAAAKKEAKQNQQQQQPQQREQQQERPDYEKDEELDPTQYFENRARAVQDLKTAGRDVYPHKFQVTMTIPEFIEKYSGLQDGEHLEDQEVSLAGRLSRVAQSGQQLRFYDLRGDGARVQLMASGRQFESGTASFFEIHNFLRRGDVVGVTGFPGKSKRGELSLFSKNIQLLAPCLHMLPERNSLRDCDLRFRHRYLDLIVNDATRRTFLIRAKIVSFLRRFLEERGFVEVETPMMSAIAGGAAARPFRTHHNELDADLFLRIAPELFLKMLVVGGLEKVFEIGKNFRNEGVDMTHNPEFTACEFYWAYADHRDLMDLTEVLLSSMVKEICGSYKIEFHPEGPGNPAVELDFTPPYKRLSLVEEIEKQANVQLPRPLHSEACISFMKNLLKKRNVELPQPPTSAKLLDALCGEFVECQATNKPLFIIDHPQIMSPLAKWHRSQAELTERFELFIMGKELCNAYTELNDPFKQRDCFLEQAKARAAGDDEATLIDETFCTSLEYGLPPTGGWGLGIDRLTMFLSDHNTIKDVILFPTMRPQPHIG